MTSNGEFRGLILFNSDDVCDQVSLRQFFDQLAVSIGVNKVSLLSWGLVLQFHGAQASDWYKISRKEVIKQGGSAIFDRRHSSLASVLRVAYPEVQWEDSLFVGSSSSASKLPRFHWRRKSNLLAALSRAEKILEIRQVCWD